METVYFNEKQAAEYSASTVHLLRRWRREGGGGFPFIKTESGSIRYAKADIDKYMESRKVKNTAQGK